MSASTVWSSRSDGVAPASGGADAPGAAGPLVAAIDLASATQAAALAAPSWVGRGDKNAADGAAVAAMRRALSTVRMDGVVVIGEGEKDQAPMLFTDERVGSGQGSACDVAVDPIDGTRLAALGLDNAVSVLAVSARGSMFDASSVF